MTKLNVVLEEFAISTRDVFGDKLVAIILFGSYARGDYDVESDVDVAILADIAKEAKTSYHSQLIIIMDVIYEKFDYPVVLSPIVISVPFFEEWKNDLPFYRNVVSDGVRIGA